MFTNFIYIIIATLVYSFHSPDGKPQYPWPVYPAGFVFFYFLYAYFTFRFFKKRLETLDNFSSYGPWERGQYQRYLNRHILLSLAAYAALLYSLELKTVLASVPSETVRSILGIAPFFLFLMVLWSIAWPLHHRLFSSKLTRTQYIASQMRFNLPVPLPWLIATLCLDLAILLPEGIHEALLTHEWTQLVLYAFFFLFLGIFFPLFTKTIWGCKTITDPGLLELLTEVCKEAGVKVRHAIMWPVMEMQVITAGVMGIASRFRYILLTPSIIQILSREELKSVLAHELGHTKKFHLHFFLLFFMGYAVLSLLYPDTLIWFLYGSGIVGHFTDFFLSGNKNLMTVLFFAPLMFLLYLYFRFLFGFFSRNFERQADLFSLQLIGKSEPLISALDKVASVNGIDKNAPNWHHFSVRERVDFLRDCEKQPKLAANHHRKVFYYKFIYFAALLLITSCLIVSWQYPPHATVRLGLVESSLLKIAKTEGGNPELHLLLADIRLEKKDFRKASESYHRVLELDPKNTTALNNLAWILVTSEDQALLNYEEGVRLAERAATIERKAFILDTLAECYFVNGEIKKAIQTEEEAMALEKGDKSHYKKQLEKFREGFTPLTNGSP